MDHKQRDPCTRDCLRCRRPFLSPDRTTRFLCDACNAANARVRQPRTARFPSLDGHERPPPAAGFD